MNPQNNVDSQRSMNNPGQPAGDALRPGSSEKEKLNRSDDKNLRNTEDDKATAGRQFGAEDYNEKEDERKRYDEADPNWRNPDVEMNTPDINPELEANIGPQS